MPLAYNKFNSFVQDLNTKKIDVSADALYALLTNTAPVAGDTVVDTTTTPCTIKATSNAVEIAAGNGYTKKGALLSVSTASQTGGTFTLAAHQVIYTAAGGAIGPFRYIALFDDTSGAAATRSVIAWFDYGAGLTLNDGDSFTLQFNSAEPGTVYTLA